MRPGVRVQRVGVIRLDPTHHSCCCRGFKRDAGKTFVSPALMMMMMVMMKSRVGAPKGGGATGRKPHLLPDVWREGDGSHDRVHARRIPRTCVCVCWGWGSPAPG